MNNFFIKIGIPASTGTQVSQLTDVANKIIEFVKNYNEMLALSTRNALSPSSKLAPQPGVREEGTATFSNFSNETLSPKRGAMRFPLFHADVRIGIASGVVIGGVFGSYRFRYFISFLYFFP